MNNSVQMEWLDGPSEIPGHGWLMPGQEFTADPELAEELLERGAAKKLTKSGKKGRKEAASQEE